MAVRRAVIILCNQFKNLVKFPPKMQLSDEAQEAVTVELSAVLLLPIIV